MRAPSAGSKVGILLGLLMLFLIAPMVIVLSMGTDPGVLPPGGIDVPTTTPADPTPATAEPNRTENAQVPRRSGQTVATRTIAGKISAEGLADAATACIRVLDLADQTPIAGAAVRRVQGGAELGFTDDRGLVGLPIKQAEQLAVLADGYLLRMAPTQLGTTEAEPQRVQLVRDAWSMVRQFEFVGRDGRAAGEAFVRFRPQKAAGGTAVVGPASESAALQRAWSEHLLLATQPVCVDVLVQLGTWSQDRVHRLAHRAAVRFAASGEFLAEVATTTGLVGQATFRLEASQTGNQPPIRIALEAGAYVAGTVVGGVQPLAGAEVTLQGGEPLGLLATTGDDGRFRLGPLPRGEATLHVRHGDHQPLAFGPVAADASGVRVVLQPLPKSTLRGRVRSRPELQPIAGARLSWAPNGAAVVTATAAADGTFQLAATGDQAARLLVSAPGYLPYAELVEPGSPFAEYDLWPAASEVRLAKGLTARLAGIVVDAQGRAMPGVSVRWIPARTTQSVGMPGRRTLEGGALALPLVISTGTDGTFQIETNQFGPGRICLAEAGPSATGGVETEAVAGASKDGLRLQR